MPRCTIPSVLILTLLLAACTSTPPYQGGDRGRRTAPVYEVVAQGLTDDEAGRLREAFRLAELALDEHGVARYVDEKAFLAVPTRELPPGEAESEDEGPVVFERFDFEALRSIQVPAPEEARSRAAEALRGADLLPREAEPVATHTRFEATSAEGETLADHPIATAVSYRFSLRQVPLEGPGAKVRVAYGAGGEVVQLLHSVLRLEPGAEVPIVGRAEAADRCATWTTSGYEGGDRRVSQATLAYYAPHLSTRPERLEPSYRCETVHPNGAVGQVYFVPAAVQAERPALAPAPQERRAGADPQEAVAALVGRVDVGSEGTGPCSGLPHTAANVASFNNRMSSAGVAVQFSWVDANAWEDDWKDPSRAGNDSTWVDNVDMAYWQGHGWPGGFSFSGCSSIDDASMTNADALWGNRDAEWISLFTCLVLAAESGGQRWWQRWGPAFDRLHQINSFDTVSYHSSQHGGIYADYLVRRPFLWWNDPMKVRQAWAQASIDDQPPQVVWATMGVISTAGSVNWNDYFWGHGPVGPDVPAGQIRGYWRVSGGS